MLIGAGIRRRHCVRTEHLIHGQPVRRRVEFRIGFLESSDIIICLVPIGLPQNPASFIHGRLFDIISALQFVESRSYQQRDILGQFGE